MAGHSPSKTGVNALMPGHPRLVSTDFKKKDVDRPRAGTGIAFGKLLDAKRNAPGVLGHMFLRPFRAQVGG
jgi:hypothetical protein